MKTSRFNIPPRSLKCAGKWLFWRAIVLALTIRLLLKLVSFKTAVRFLKIFEKKHKNEPTAAFTEDDLKKYRLMIQLSYKFWPAINCLSTSLAFWLVLQRRGIETELRFGVLMEGEKLRSHAWLEHENSILSPDDAAVEKYKTFAKAIL